MPPVFSLAELKFGDQQVGTASVPKNVSVKNPNTGIATLDVSHISATGDFRRLGNHLRNHAACRSLL
ncbi:MAG: hypothetical protein WCA20_18510 [Candidatus Sulfotelmatobacter sp.]